MLIFAEKHKVAVLVNVGRFFEDPVYDVDEDAASEIDKTFPRKQLRDHLASQKRFLYLLRLKRAKY